MISVEEAGNIINSVTADWGVEEIALDQCIGRVLAENIRADRDFPPFSRVTMDGIAIRFDDYHAGTRRFKVDGEQYAGEASKVLEESNACLEIMTGAMLNASMDVVIRYEDVRFEEVDGEKWAVIPDLEIDRFKNVHLKASDHQQGEVLLEAGSEIHIGTVTILATVGQAKVKVKRLPKIAVISTGDELVDVSETPMDYQIRKSNMTMIVAQLQKFEVPVQAFHLDDDETELRSALPKILDDFDVLLLSGGVSKGKADYLPEILEELGVKKHFHRVAQRPGKPFWFGQFGQQKAVFAFPGNPISTLACFRVYFLPWMKQQLGIKEETIKATLTENTSFKPDLGYFLQVKVKHKQGQRYATPEPGNGSGDLANLSRMNGFLYLPAGKTVFQKGESFRFYAI